MFTIVYLVMLAFVRLNNLLSKKYPNILFIAYIVNPISLIDFLLLQLTSVIHLVLYIRSEIIYMCAIKAPSTNNRILHSLMHYAMSLHLYLI